MVNLQINIPEGFLDEEVRCGYTISRKMKEVWAVQLDLFAEFDRVCKKHGITYIASGGTMLGAVRHHGYIPWDDDMDLMMMRDQYEKLCQIAPAEFRHPYFFQTENTDPGMRRWFARLRNINTTAIQKWELPYHVKYNQGVFIDIFPMDCVPDNQNIHNQLNKQIKKLYSWYFRSLKIEKGYLCDFEPLYKRIRKKITHYALGGIFRQANISQRVYMKMERIFKRYNDDYTEFVSLLSFQYDNLDHAIRRNDMNNIIYVDFEFLKIPIIANYDEHLKRKYGDYMTPHKNPNYHGDVIFDTNVGFEEYYKKHPELNSFHK